MPQGRQSLSEILFPSGSTLKQLGSWSQSSHLPHVTWLRPRRHCLKWKHWPHGSVLTLLCITENDVAYIHTWDRVVNFYQPIFRQGESFSPVSSHHLSTVTAQHSQGDMYVLISVRPHSGLHGCKLLVLCPLLRIWVDLVKKKKKNWVQWHTLVIQGTARQETETGTFWS